MTPSRAGSTWQGIGDRAVAQSGDRLLLPEVREGQLVQRRRGGVERVSKRLHGPKVMELPNGETKKSRCRPDTAGRDDGMTGAAIEATALKLITHWVPLTPHTGYSREQHKQ